MGALYSRIFSKKDLQIYKKYIVRIISIKYQLFIDCFILVAPALEDQCAHLQGIPYRNILLSSIADLRKLPSLGKAL